VTTTDLYGIEGQVLDGQFRVDRAIGEGGFSVVYRGLHIGLDEPVAIKCLKLPTQLQSSVVDGIVRRFRDESKIHYRLSRGSLHIARTIAAGTTMAPATGALVPYMVLEWLEGFTLAEELRARRMRGESGRSLQEVIRLLDPVAEAMAFAHAQGVVHRDLNPSNIFVAHAQGTAKLKVLDFGVAKVISDHALSLGPRVATIGQIRMFTPAYAAPEQFHDALGIIGPYTDVYSFAVLLVELLADRAPIDGEHIGEYADKALDPVHRPTPRSLGIPIGDAVEAVLARAVTVDPSQRPRDIGEFWGMLKNAATRDANQSRGAGEFGFPQPPVMAAPSARGVTLSKNTAGGLPGMPDPVATRPSPLPAGPSAPAFVAAAPVADLVPDTRGPGWRPQAGAAFANTVGPARAPSSPALDPTMEADAAGRTGPPRKATLFQGTPAMGGSAAVAPKPAPTIASPLPPPPMGSPLPPPPGGVVSHTALASTVASPAAAEPLPPMPASPHLGDTAPSAVLRAAMGGPQAVKPAARWYTPSLEGNTPFPMTPPSIPTPSAPPSKEPTKKPKPRLMIVLALVLTIALVLAAVLASYFSPQ
jgi:serine/threonine-protein kinase